MKKFSRILAVVLALITVLTTLPISIIADSWLDVEAEEMPNEATKVTVTLDAKALATMIKEEGLSKDSLRKILESAEIDREGLLQVFTLEDLFDIVPQEKLFELFDLKEIIEKIGLDKLSTMIDIPALLAGCDKAALADLLKSVPELYKYADVERLITEGYIPNQIILDNIKQEELEKAVKGIDPNSVIPAVLGLPTFADIQKVIRVYDLVLKDGVIDPMNVLNMTAVETLAKQLFNDPMFDVGAYLDCVRQTAAKEYFKEKYGNTDLNNIENLKALRDMIRGGYLEAEYVYHVDDVNLLALIDNGFIDMAEVEADIHDYVESVFMAMDLMTLKGYADMGMFTYTYDPLAGTVVVTGVDMHMVLEERVVTVAELRQNCPALEAHMEQHIDEWTHDDTMFDKMIEMIEKDYIDIVIESYSFSNIHYNELIKDGYVSASEMLLHDLIDVNALAIALVEDGVITINESLIDSTKLKNAVAAVDPAVLIGYVNTAEFIETFGVAQIIEWLGGYDKAMACIDIPGVTREVMNILPSIMEKLAENGVPLTEVIYLSELLKHLDFMAVVELIGIENIMNQLDNDELIELLRVADLKAHLRELLLLFYNYGMKNIDKIVLNGHVVAEQDYTDLLKVDAAELLLVVESLIPTLDDLAELESNMLTSLDFEMEYLPEDAADSVTKHIIFEFALAGGIEQIKNAASKLRELISKYVNNYKVSFEGVNIDLRVPNKLANGYLALLESDRIPESVKQKLITIPDMNGDEIVAFVNDNITFEDLIAILNAIKPSEVFEKVKNSAFVEAVLAKLGKNVPNVTLNDLWKAVQEKNITINNILDAIERITKRDVKAILEAALPKVDGFIDRAEEIAQIQSLLALVEGKLGIDVSEISLTEILERNADENLLDKISDVVAARVGVNIRAAMANNTPDEFWAKAVEKASQHEAIYNKVRNYLLMYIDKIPDALMSLSIADFYVGNGVFFADKTVELDTKKMVEKLLEKLLGKVNDPQIHAAIELLMTRVEDHVLPVDISATVRFNNLYRITFMDRNGAGELFSAFLPTGADLGIYKHNSDVTGFEFAGWQDENGFEVTKMPNRDITVYATANAITLTFVDANGNVLKTLEAPKGTSFALERYAQMLAELNASVAGLAPTGANDALIYTPWRVLWNVDGTVIDLEKSIGLDTVFNEDKTLVVDFAREYLLYFSDPAVEYDVIYDNGVYTVTVRNEFAKEYSLNIKNLLPKAAADASVALKLVVEEEGIVLAEIKNATLASLNTVTANDACVWFNYKENATVPAAFAGTFYEGKEIPSYSFAFLVSEATDAADATVVTADFGGESVTLQLPYANAVANTDYMTRVYKAANGKRAYIATAVVADGVIEFALDSFADIVISDEYLLEVTFDPSVIGALRGDYADANGDIYLPAGAQIELFFDITGDFIIESITDSAQNTYAVGQVFTMPAEDEVLTVTLYEEVEETTVKLTFADANGNVIAELVVEKGFAFTQNLLALKDINEMAVLYAPTGAYDALIYTPWSVLWSVDGALIDLENAIGLDTVFNEDKTLVVDFARAYLLYFSDPTVDYDVTYENGVYIVTVHGAMAQSYCLNIKDLLPKAAVDASVALKLVIEEEGIVLAEIKNATLASLNAVTANDACVWFKVEENAAVTSAFANTFYAGKDIPCYSFAFLASEATDASDASAVNADFGGESVKIQLPYANAAANTEYMTRVYTAADGKRTYIVTAVVADGVIEFALDSFADIVISDEYLLNVTFTPAMAGLLKGEYYDQNGDLYFPAGAQFKLFFDGISSNYEIVIIRDNSGNTYDEGQLFTMPAGEETLKVSLKSTQVTLTFKDENGNKITSLEVPKGTYFALPEYATILDAINAAVLNNSPAISGDDAKLFGSWRVIWKYGTANKIDAEKNIGMYTPFNSDTTLTCDWGKNYFLYFSDSSIDYDVTYDAGLYTVSVHSGFAKAYDLNIKDLLPKAAADETVALKLVIEQKNIVLAEIKNATLASLNEATASDACVWFSYKTNNAVSDLFAGTFYEGKVLPSYSFAFTATATDSVAGARVVTVDFGGEAVKIQLPYANAKTGDCMTRVYTAANGTRVYLPTTVVKSGVIGFALDSFSDIVISDEYRLNVVFLPAIEGALLGGYADANGDLYLPAGAEIALNFEIADGYILDNVIDSNANEYAVGDTFTMPESAATLTVYSHSVESKQQFHVYYYYFDPETGELKQAADPYSYYPEAFDAALALNPDNVYADALGAVLPGYNKNEFLWSELDESLVGVADLSLFMIRIPITYTVQFVETDGTLISTLEGLTVENAEQVYKLPDLPAGVVGKWVVVSSEAPEDETDPAQNLIVITLKLQTRVEVYEIIHGANVSDETPYFALAGETVYVTVEEFFGYTAEISVKNAAGESITVVNGSFTMPAQKVIVNVTYKPEQISYTINQIPSVGNYMETVHFEIVLENGQFLKSISEECTLVSTVIDGDKTVLTYAFLLDGEKAITYKLESSKVLIDRIHNGTLFDGGFFPEMEGDTLFEKWGNALFNALSFATFSSPEEESCSPVWCWILVILAILIVAIVVLCILGTKGIIVPGLTFLATAVANGFFWLCILLAKMAKKVASLFRKG